MAKPITMKHQGIDAYSYRECHPEPHHTRTRCGLVVPTMSLLGPGVVTCPQCLELTGSHSH